MYKLFFAFLSIAIVLTSTLVVTTANEGPAVVAKVYTIDNAAANHVLVFTRGSDGSLVASGNYSTQGNGTGSGLASQGAVDLSPNGQWLLVVDAGSNEITVFQVNGNALVFADKVSSHGIVPISITINVDNNLVYVLDNGSATTPGNIAGFQFSNTGKLTYIGGSNQPLSGAPNTSPEQIGFSPDGRLLVVTEKAANIIDTYQVNYAGIAGAPMTTPSTGLGPYGFAFISHFLVISEAASNTLSSYAWSDSGTLRTLSGAMPTFGNAPCWVAVNTEYSSYVYTSNAHGGTISGFTLSGIGTLNLFSSIAAKARIPSLDLAFSKGGEFLYALNGNNITGFKTYFDGSLSQITTVGGLPASTTGLAAS